MTLFELKKLIDKACDEATRNHGEAAEECKFYLYFVMESHDRIVVRPTVGENYLVMMEDPPDRPPCDNCSGH